MWIITNQKQQKLFRAESSCVKCVNGSPTRRAILQLSLGSVVYVNLSFFNVYRTQSNPIQSNLYCKNTADRTQRNNRQT